MRQRLEALLPQEVIRTDVGELQVLKVFFGIRGRQIVGGRVTKGDIAKGLKVEIRRADSLLARGDIIDVQMNKVPVEKVSHGRECGLTITGQEKKIKEGDTLVAYREETRKKTLQ